MGRDARPRASVLNRLDLNLIRLFDVVMRERSVVRAGHALGLSQSAVSHGLGRLRALLADDLFVRTAQGMEPTPRAVAMAAQVRDALTAIEGAVGPQAFDPTRSTRQFRLAATDYVTAVLGPPLLRLFAVRAPQASLIIRPATRIDVTMQVDLGQIDVVIGTFAQVPRRLNARTLFEDQDVLAVRRDHPDVGSLHDLDRLAGLPLMAVSVGGPEDGLPDGFLSERGLTRRTEMFDRGAMEGAFATRQAAPRLGLLQPHFLAVPSLLAVSDYVAIIPCQLAQTFEAAGLVRSAPLPWSALPMSVQMVWHERWTHDPAHVWLRGMLDEATKLGASAFPSR